MNRIIILFLIVLSSCKNDKTAMQFNLEGNWSLIDIDSTYSEIKIRNDTIITYNEYLRFLPLKSFDIKGDSMFISQNIDKSINTRGFLLKMKDEESYILSSLKMNGEIVLKKIDSSSYTFDKLKNLKETLRFRVDFENRKNLILGIDKRFSYSDTIITSLDKNIDTTRVKLN